MQIERINDDGAANSLIATLAAANCVHEQSQLISLIFHHLYINSIRMNLHNITRPDQMLENKMDEVYLVDALRDDYEELEENHRILQKELKSKIRQHESLKRDHKKLERDTLEQEEQFKQKFELQSQENAKLNTNLQQVEEELEKHKKLLEQSEKLRAELVSKQLPVADDIEATRGTNKQTREYHYKWKMAESENAVLVTSISRLESQVSRLKESLAEAETIEKDLRAERRKLLRDLRESQAKNEELETNNTHLHKRLDRMRSRNLLNSSDQPPQSVPETSQQ